MANKYPRSNFTWDVHETQTGWTLCDFLQMAVRDALTSAMDEEMTRDDKVSFIRTREKHPGWILNGSMRVDNVILPVTAAFPGADFHTSSTLCTGICHGRRGS